MAAILSAVLPYIRFELSEGTSRLLVVITLAILILTFAYLYPRANVQSGNMGSDDDDALNIAVSELWHAHYPYYARTYLGNVIHHLPGAFLINAPFVFLGSSALQNLLWLALFFVVLRKELHTTFRAWRWLLILLTLSPIVLHQLVTGTEHFGNALYVLIALWWLFRARRKMVPAIAFGLVLSSRANFLFLLPLAFGCSQQREGWRTSLRWIFITIMTFALITLPFYFYDPEGFSPLHAANRLTRFDHLLPHAALIVMCGMAMLSAALGFARLRSAASMWSRCALVQAFPVIVGAILGGGLLYLSYGTFFLPFGILAAAFSEPGSEYKREKTANRRPLPLGANQTSM